MSNTTTTTIKYLNVLAYILNAAVTYLIGVIGIFGTKTNTELSKKYSTLVTPAGFAFAIWSIIFLSQLIFVLVQLINKPIRSKALVTKGVAYNYIGVCLAQIAWTLAFSYEIIWLSFICMLSILYFLITIYIKQYKVLQEEDESNIKDFWLLQFPFSIHCGWILAASCVNLSVVLVKYSTPAIVQFYIALASLVFIIGVSLLNIFLPRSQYVIPVVLAWASFGIYSELQNPNELIIKTFSESTISTIQYGAISISVSILLVAAIRSAIKYIKPRFFSSVGDEEENAYAYVQQEEN
mmetsp:Transcript_223/g.260  ORF Transcript_223/g.260 Transcript_223/m.260 type:complete len:295 (-) Transcript_223:203-1087(-)